MYTLYTQTTETLHVRCSMCTHDLNLAVIYHLLCASASSLPSTLTVQIQYIQIILLFICMWPLFNVTHIASFMVYIVYANVIIFLYLLLNIYTPVSKKMNH